MYYFTQCVFVCWCVLYVAQGGGGSIIYLMPFWGLGWDILTHVFTEALHLFCKG